MHTKKILSMFVGTAVTLVFADDYSGYVWLDGVDTAANQSWNAKGHWSD